MSNVSGSNGFTSGVGVEIVNASSSSASNAKIQPPR